MDRRVYVKFGVLNILLQTPGRIDTKDVQEPSVIVEWIAVDVIRWLLARENEDGSSLRVCVVGLR